MGSNFVWNEVNNKMHLDTGSSNERYCSSWREVARLGCFIKVSWHPNVKSHQNSRLIWATAKTLYKTLVFGVRVKKTSVRFKSGYNIPFSQFLLSVYIIS